MAEAPAQTRAARALNFEHLVERVSQLEAEIERKQAARREAEARTPNASAFKQWYFIKRSQYL